MRLLDPVLVEKPDTMPVSLEEAKVQCRVDFADDDASITHFIGAATDHYDGYRGILGRCIVEQTWLQGYPCFSSEMKIRLGDVLTITKVEYVDPEGEIQTFHEDNYTLYRYSGLDCIALKSGVDIPETACLRDAVRITYTAGFGAAAAVPPALKQVILFEVAHFYENREGVTMARNVEELPLGIIRMMTPFRLRNV